MTTEKSKQTATEAQKGKHQKLHVQYAELQIQLEQTLTVAEQLRQQKARIYQQIMNLEK